MAIDFPSNPSDGYEWTDPAGTTWVYSLDKNAWSKVKPPSEAGDISYTYPGGVEQSVQTRLEQRVSVKDFGAVGDGTTDDTLAIRSAITSVLASNNVLYFPEGTYSVNPNFGGADTRLQFTYSGSLKLIGDNATISNKAFSQQSGDIRFTASDGASTTLASDAADQDTTITVADATGIEAGQLLRITSTDSPATSRPEYGKWSVLKVAAVDKVVTQDGIKDVITLSDPLNWWFTVAEGTTVQTWDYASCTIRGISYTMDVPVSSDPFDAAQMGGKIAFQFTQDSEYSDAKVTCPGLRDGRGISFASNYNVYCRDLIIKNGQYPVRFARSRNVLVERVQASDCRHPFDPAEWCFNVTIKNLHGINTQNSLQCHASFNVNYIDCTDQSTYVTGGLSLRSIGGSLINCTAISPLATESSSGVSLEAAYNDIRLNYNTTYKNVVALGGTASAPGNYGFFIEKCKFNSIFCDIGQSSSPGLSVLSVDADTTTVQSVNRATRLEQVRSATETTLIDTPFTDMSKFVDDGSGLFVCNETFVVDPRAIPSLGHYPNTKFRAVLFHNTSGSAPKNISIPVKVIDPFDVLGYRRGMLDMWLRIHTGVGLVTARYQGTYKHTATSALGIGNKYIDSISNIATGSIANIAPNFASQGASSYANG